MSSVSLILFYRLFARVPEATWLFSRIKFCGRIVFSIYLYFTYEGNTQNNFFFIFIYSCTIVSWLTCMLTSRLMLWWHHFRQEILKKWEETWAGSIYYDGSSSKLSSLFFSFSYLYFHFYFVFSILFQFKYLNSNMVLVKFICTFKQLSMRCRSYLFICYLINIFPLIEYAQRKEN
jgi:hypothetical protein